MTRVVPYKSVQLLDLYGSSYVNWTKAAELDELELFSELFFSLSFVEVIFATSEATISSFFN